MTRETALKHPYVALETIRANAVKFAASQAELIGNAMAPYEFSFKLEEKVEEAVRDLAQGLHDVIGDLLADVVKEVVGEDEASPLGRWPEWGSAAVEAYRTDPVRIARARLRSHIERTRNRDLPATFKALGSEDIEAALAGERIGGHP